jgi:hypothetical protein
MSFTSVITEGTVLTFSGSGFVTVGSIWARVIVTNSVTLITTVYTVPITSTSDTSMQILLEIQEANGSAIKLELSTDRFSSVTKSWDLTYSNPNSAFSATFTSLNNTLQFLAPVTDTLPGVDGQAIDMRVVPNNGTMALVLSSVFLPGVKSRRAVKTSGSYMFNNMMAFLDLIIDSNSTSGNVVEMWMYASQDRFLQSALSLDPRGNSLLLNFNSTDALSMLTTNVSCNFITGVLYHMELQMIAPGSSDAQWKANTRLLRQGAQLCSSTLTLQNFDPEIFFSTQFSFLLSQSSSGTGFSARSIKTSSGDSLSLQISKMGISCQQDAVCGSSSSNPTPSVAPDTAHLSIGVIIAVAATIAGFALVGIIIVVIIVAIVSVKRRRRVATYESSE